MKECFWGTPFFIYVVGLLIRLTDVSTSVEPRRSRGEACVFCGTIFSCELLWLGC